MIRASWRFNSGSRMIPHVIITVESALVPSNHKPSAATGLTTKLYIFFFKFVSYQRFWIHFNWWSDDIIHYDRQDIVVQWVSQQWFTITEEYIGRCELASWWRHQMEAFPRYWPFVRKIHWSPVNSPHKGQWRRPLMFSFICDWIYDWVKIVRIVIWGVIAPIMTSL